MKNYEAMFVLDTGSKPLEAFQEDIKQLIARHGGQILKAEKWTERRLAYPIAGKKRGTYYIVFFEALTSAITALEKEIHLKDQYLRVLFLDNPGGKDARIPTPPEEGDRVGMFKPEGMFGRPDRDAAAGAAH